MFMVCVFFIPHTDSSPDESVSVAERVKMVSCLFIDQLQIILIIIACVLYYCGELSLAYAISQYIFKGYKWKCILLLLTRCHNSYYDKFCSHSKGSHYIK